MYDQCATRTSSTKSGCASWHRMHEGEGASKRKGRSTHQRIAVYKLLTRCLERFQIFCVTPQMGQLLEGVKKGLQPGTGI